MKKLFVFSIILLFEILSYSKDLADNDRTDKSCESIVESKAKNLKKEIQSYPLIVKSWLSNTDQFKLATNEITLAVKKTKAQFDKYRNEFQNEVWPLLLSDIDRYSTKKKQDVIPTIGRLSGYRVAMSYNSELQDKWCKTLKIFSLPCDHLDDQICNRFTKPPEIKKCLKDYLSLEGPVVQSLLQKYLSNKLSSGQIIVSVDVQSNSFRVTTSKYTQLSYVSFASDSSKSHWEIDSPRDGQWRNLKVPYLVGSKDYTISSVPESLDQYVLRHTEVSTQDYDTIEQASMRCEPVVKIHQKMNLNQESHNSGEERKESTQR